QAEDGIRDYKVTGVQTCALPISGAYEHGGCLVIDRAGVRVPADAEVLARPAAVLVADVAFTHIARDHENFLGRAKHPRLAQAHDFLRCLHPSVVAVDAGAARGASVAAWAAAATATGALALLSLADFEGATVEVGGVQRLHGSRGVGIRHLNEAETTRATRVTVDDQRHFLDGTVLGKQGAHGLIGRREWQISYI